MISQTFVLLTIELYAIVAADALGSRSRRIKCGQDDASSSEIRETPELLVDEQQSSIVTGRDRP